MTLLRFLSSVGYPQVPRSHSVGVFYKFVRCSTVPQVKSIIDSRANFFGASYEADVLQNNCLKKNLSLRVTFPTSYAAKLHSECRDEIFLNPDRWYFVALGGQINKFFISLST